MRSLFLPCATKWVTTMSTLECVTSTMPYIQLDLAARLFSFFVCLNKCTMGSSKCVGSNGFEYSYAYLSFMICKSKNFVKINSKTSQIRIELKNENWLEFVSLRPVDKMKWPFLYAHCSLNEVSLHCLFMHSITLMEKIYHIRTKY